MKKPTKYTVLVEKDGRCEAADAEAYRIVCYAAGNYFLYSFAVRLTMPAGEMLTDDT